MVAWHEAVAPSLFFHRGFFKLKILPTALSTLLFVSGTSLIGGISTFALSAAADPHTAEECREHRLDCDADGNVDSSDTEEEYDECYDGSEDSQALIVDNGSGMVKRHYIAEDCGEMDDDD